MGVLAEWVVNITTKGAEVAKKGIDAVGGTLETVAKKLEKFQTFAKVAFTAMSVGLVGIVRAGLQGTEQGERMSAAWQKLSQQIAAVFLPVVEKVTELLERVTDWFASLSSEQQDSIMKWTLWVAGALAAIIIIPKLIAGFVAIKAALVAIAANPVLLGLAAVGAILVGLIKLMNTLKENSENVAKNLAEMPSSAQAAAGALSNLPGMSGLRGGPGGGADAESARRDATQKAKGKSSIEAGDAVYKRIMEASAGGNIDKQQLKAQEGMWSEIIKLKDAFMRTQPAAA